MALHPRQKKLIGVVGFLPALILYMGLVLWISDHLPALWYVQLPYYLIVGVIWAFPLKPIFRWMNRPIGES